MSIDADGFVLRREVHLPPAAHPVNVAPTQLGHSIGQWEGKTLVIDTVAFSPGRGQSARKHMIERLALTEDRHQLRYEVIVEDPDNYPTPSTTRCCETIAPTSRCQRLRATIRLRGSSCR